MRTIKNSLTRRRRYIFFKTKDTVSFYEDAEREGVTYGDNGRLNEGDDIMALQPNGTICFGWAGECVTTSTKKCASY